MHHSNLMVSATKAFRKYLEIFQAVESRDSRVPRRQISGLLSFVRVFPRVILCVPLKLPLAIRVPSDIRLSTVSISCFEFSTAFTNKIEPCEFEIGQWRSCKKLYTKAHYRKQLHSCSESC